MAADTEPEGNPKDDAAASLLLSLSKLAALEDAHVAQREERTKDAGVEPRAQVRPPSPSDNLADFLGLQD